ncbi:MAG: initiation control protein YabA [Streptococcaceae bacterium]|jgi:regulator of replication initiation timing|nr:initiation control protein YabA [Streptococcaceae bacterium]
MDKKEIYDSLSQMEGFYESTLKTIAKMKTDVQLVIEENNELLLENSKLRQRLHALERTKNDKTEGNGTGKPEEKSKAKVAIEKVYTDGFHVCSVSYGQRRENDEDCMLCYDVLDKLN